jgi:DNA-binding LacI/PurR family transcriptional regulator
MPRHTIYTIAKNLGISPSTVSKVINHKGNFSDELRERVLDHIRSIGYVPATSARVLRSRRTWTIGVIYLEESHIGLEHPFFSGILQSFKDEVEKNGYDLTFIVKQVGHNKMSYLNWCINKKIDGVLIVVGSHNNPDLIELVESEIPCISTDVVREHLHTIISDNDQGIRLSVDHAMNIGRMNIGMVSGPPTARHFLYRFQKLMSVMQERGLPYRTENMISAKGFGYKSGYDATKELLARTTHRPDMLLVGSDMLAFGVIHAIEDMGYKVPGDIAVIGYDDIAFSQMSKPSLSTIRQDIEQIGKTAATKLLEMIDLGLKNETKMTRIPVELVIRESTNVT